MVIVKSLASSSLHMAIAIPCFISTRPLNGSGAAAAGGQGAGIRHRCGPCHLGRLLAPLSTGRMIVLSGASVSVGVKGAVLRFLMEPVQGPIPILGSS